MKRGGRDIVGIATCYRLESPELEPWWGRNFLHPSRLAPRPSQSPVQWVLGLFPGVRRPLRGVDHPPLLALRSSMGRAKFQPPCLACYWATMKRVQLKLYC
jgi:hypothetical protein